MPNPPPARLVLASTSRYRRELLNRLNIPFEVAAPNTDETPLPGETPQALAGNVILSKPGNFDNAVVQLKLMRGKAVHFFTALCLLNSRSGQQQTALVPVTVHMREYSDVQLERYLHAEEPYDCAGSARIEGLGITLVAKLEGDDPNALIGLPLIALCDMLRNEGLDLP